MKENFVGAKQTGWQVGESAGCQKREIKGGDAGTMGAERDPDGVTGGSGPFMAAAKVRLWGWKVKRGQRVAPAVLGRERVPSRWS